jgi:hypothetical protein
MTKRTMTNRVLLLELSGFGFVVAVLWANEILDLPHAVFGTSPTPINWMESILETVVASALAAVTLLLTRDCLNRIKILEGFVPTCAHCKRIRVGETWVPLEDYIDANSDARMTHGLCPYCLEMEYGFKHRSGVEAVDGDKPNAIGIERNTKIDRRGRR